MAINTIVFDLGGVIIPLNRPRCEAAFRALKSEGFEEAYHARWESGFFDKYEIGGMSSDDFAGQLADALDSTVDDVKDAWNSMFEPIPPRHIEILQELARDYKLFLLSNTNAIHMDWIRAHLFELGAENFAGVFDVQFLSYELNCRKPEKEIFEKVEGMMGLPHDSFVFVDDTQENIDGASSCGWNTLHHPFNEPMDTLLARLKAF